MKLITRFNSVGIIAAAAVLVAGCASDSSNKTAKSETEQPKKSSKHNPVANPSKVKFGEFKRVEIKPITIAEKHAHHKGNQESAAKIDSMLQEQLRKIFTEIVALPQGAEFSKPSERTLQIAPHIQDIRLISGGTRFWLGAMAGGSDLLMQVTYRDSATGEVIADPEVAAGSNAWAGAWTMGATDNQIRDGVVREIMGYTMANQ